MVDVCSLSPSLCWLVPVFGAQIQRISIAATAFKASHCYHCCRPRSPPFYGRNSAFVVLKILPTLTFKLICILPHKICRLAVAEADDDYDNEDKEMAWALNSINECHSAPILLLSLRESAIFAFYSPLFYRAESVLKTKCWPITAGINIKIPFKEILELPASSAYIVGKGNTFLLLLIQLKLDIKALCFWEWAL